MPNFHMQKQVGHSAQKMFALVADIESYPQFLPMCEALTIRSRQEKEGNTLLVADMTVGYKLIRENFTTQVYLQPAARRIDVHYVDGPFKYLENRWQFLPLTAPAAGRSEQAGEEYRPDSAILASGSRSEETLPAGEAVQGIPAIDNIEEKKRKQQQEDSRRISVDIPEITPGGRKRAESEITGRQPAGAESKGRAEAAVTGRAAEAETCRVDFYIDYAFKNPLLAALMGTMFDIAFRRFTAAFETRADAIYGISG
ncbi:type II toxin-antitoxin system RatA family toxin [Candidatus Tokpelaia sp.]|uniref:type II toxin-antitoxin system RatA family toxin n=1 Tax=Candidatus Tokpelaia sp. TaxID=2233777 RepID=UPI00123A4E29|nr:SRPBCC family protein [Candidatus Tokpelaia sp.]KAA6404927.1 hypothetical protein DPQ22_08560 [Candidatus Tokpelaia sp.]